MYVIEKFKKKLFPLSLCLSVRFNTTKANENERKTLINSICEKTTFLVPFGGFDIKDDTKSLK